MPKIELESLSDKELLEIAKASSQLVNKRIENKKLELIAWARKFKNKEDMVISYMGDTVFTGDQIVQSLMPFFGGTVKEKIEQITEIMKDLIKKSKVIKNGDSYSATR